MTDKLNDTSVVKSQDIIQPADRPFKKKVLRLSALACNRTDRDDFDIQEAEIEAKHGLAMLADKDGVQEMLAAQMLSIHRYQQLAMAMANEPNTMDIKQYFTNAAIKLANTFVQQANLLNKLQGNSGQKIIVEHVNWNSSDLM